MPYCPRCRADKPLSDFNKKTGKKHSSYCRACNALNLKEHYAANKTYYGEKAARQKLVLQWHVLEYLSDKCCMVCGEDDPVVLQFDHRDDVVKVSSISLMMKNRRSWKSIMSEIDKCDIRCANCHTRRTAQQFGWYSIRVGVTGNTAGFDPEDSRFDP